MSDLAWVNGRIGGTIDPRDRGVTLGDGVFDTLAAFNRVPFAGDLHLERLHAQAQTIGIDIEPASVREGWQAMLDASETEHLILRTTVTRGPGGRGLKAGAAPNPTLIVTGAPWNPDLFAAPVRLVTSTITRNPRSPSSRIKSLGYLDHVLAAREAGERGGDDALLLTPSGAVACTTIANVLAIRGDRVATPPLTDGVQPGIMRRLTLRAAREIGLSPAEATLRPADLLAADRVFLTNSVRFLCPCVSLDGRPLPERGDGALARLLKAVCAQVRRECGADPRSTPKGEDPVRATGAATTGLRDAG